MVLFFVTEDWYFWSHRMELASVLRQKGFNVTLGAHFTAREKDVQARGIQTYPVPFRRSMKHPVNDVLSCIAMVRAVFKFKPKVVHLVAIKPILLSFLCLALFRDVKFVHAFAGLGYIFSANTKQASGTRIVLKPILKWILARRNSFVLVQNLDDKGMLMEELGAQESRVFVIPGSGIDVAKYFPKQDVEARKAPTIMLIGRMLAEKGCREFAAAAKVLRVAFPNSRFVLVGGTDNDNPGAISESEIVSWVEAGYLEWWGRRDDIVNVLHQADVVCLPSYREGLPKSLLEAASCGIPLVATDVPGCREVCIGQHTGLLVEPKDESTLIDALSELIREPELRRKYGRNARRLVESKFSLEVISAKTISFYDEIQKS